MSVARNIKAKMKEKGINQRQLADMCGLSNASISMALSRKGKMSKKTLCLISDALDTTTEELLGALNEDKQALQTSNDGEMKNLPIADAAKLLGKSEQFVRCALQSGNAPFGFAAKITGNKYSYHISPKKFKEYIGS